MHPLKSPNTIGIIADNRYGVKGFSDFERGGAVMEFGA